MTREGLLAGAGDAAEELELAARAAADEVRVSDMMVVRKHADTANRAGLPGGTSERRRSYRRMEFKGLPLNYKGNTKPQRPAFSGARQVLSGFPRMRRQTGLNPPAAAHLVFLRAMPNISAIPGYSRVAREIDERPVLRARFLSWKVLSMR